jgi:hypothetical protein
LFKNVFEWRVKMPVKGLQRSQMLALGAVVVYQLVLRYQHEQDLPLGKGIKPLLRAAWFMTTPQLGESPKVVQTTLGHSKIAITLDIYSHVSLDLEKRAAARLNAALREQALSSAVAGNNYERCLANH